MSNYYVFTDLHGNIKLWERIKEIVKDQPAVFLGDAADRGADGFNIMRDMKDMPNLTYLRGNHEELFINGTREYKQDETIGEATELWLYNGGLATFEAWRKAGQSMNLTNWLVEQPLTFSYGRYDMCHSGCLRTKNYDDWTHQTDWDYIWHRSHFHQKWYPDRVLLHGHTPAKWVPGFTHPTIPTILQYNNNKIDLDLATAESQMIALYNLATDEVYYIDEKGIQRAEHCQV